MKRCSEVDPIDRLRQLEKKHGSQGAAAEVLGISRIYFHDMLRGRRGVSARIMDLLGLKRIVVESGTCK